MASKETSKVGRPKRRQTRASTSDGDDLWDHHAGAQTVARRATWRTTVTTVEPSSPVAVTEATSLHQTEYKPIKEVPHQQEGEGHFEHETKPALSERLKAAANHVGEQLQDTVSSAWNHAWPNWKTLAGLLLLAVLTSWLTSRFSQPDLTRRQLSAIITSVEQADRRYHALVKDLDAAQGQVHNTEDRLESTQKKLDALEQSFQGGSDKDRAKLSGKVDPSLIVNMAEQRMEKLLARFAADKTGLVDYALHSAGGQVLGHSRLSPYDESVGSSWRRLSSLLPGAAREVHPQADKSAIKGQLPRFFSTDNVGKDQYTIADKFKAIRAARADVGLSSQPVTQVLQDIWHARERVSRELKRSHPDYFQAVAQLQQIFGRLRAGAMVNKNQKERAVEPYSTQEEFTQALDNFASFYKIVRRDPNESEEVGIMRLAESLANNASVLQDAAIQHNEALAVREAEDSALAEEGSTAAADMTKGRLPNLHFGLVGQSFLEQHRRFVSMPELPQLPPGHVIQDSELPFIPQRTEAWFTARKSAVTASNMALLLGLKIPSAAKSLASAGLGVHADKNCADMTHAFGTLMAATGLHDPPPAQQRSAFASCAMQMGSIKECDVLLSYAQHMDAVKRPPCLKMHETGAVALTSIPVGVAQHASIDMAKLPRILASPDSIIKDTATGKVQLIVEAKHRFPFVEGKGQFTFLGKRRQPMKEVSVEYFSQCQLQMLVTGVERCDLISYSVGGCKIFHISRDDSWCSLGLLLLQELQSQCITARKLPTPAFYRDTMRELHGKLLRRTIESMHALSKQRVTEASSAFNRGAMDRFLDDMLETDPRKLASRLAVGSAAGSNGAKEQHCQAAAGNGAPVDGSADTGVEAAEDPVPLPPAVMPNPNDAVELPTSAAHVLPEEPQSDGNGASPVAPSSQQALPSKRTRKAPARFDDSFAVENGAEDTVLQRRPAAAGTRSATASAGPVLPTRRRKVHRTPPPGPVHPVHTSEALLPASQSEQPQVAGIASAAVLKAIELIKKPVVLAALWATTLHLDLIQGTSINENWHSWLKAHLPILGGIRTYFMLCILLQWQQMRFNSAVLTRRRRAAQEGQRSRQLHGVHEQDLRQQIAAAFSDSDNAPPPRKAYHPYMHKSYDLESMAAMGFTRAKPKASSGGRWSEAEIAGMLECLADLHKGQDMIHTQDPYYFLSHHGMKRLKSPSQVRDLLRYLEKKYAF